MGLRRTLAILTSKSETDPLHLYVELEQVVVKMLVSSAAPLLGSQRAKERMRMPRIRSSLVA